MWPGGNGRGAAVTPGIIPKRGLRRSTMHETNTELDNISDLLFVIQINTKIQYKILPFDIPIFDSTLAFSMPQCATVYIQYI